MPNTNAPTKLTKQKFARTFFASALLTPAIFTLILVTTLTTYAADKCKDISNLDERASCYDKEYQSTSKKLADVLSQKNSISGKITDLSSQLTVTDSEIIDLQNQIKELEKILAEINKNLDERKTTLANKTTLRNNLIRNYLKRTQLTELELFFSESLQGLGLNGFEFSYITQAINKSATGEIIKIILGLNSEISGFEKDKTTAEEIQKDLTADQNKLLTIKADLASRKAKAAAEYKILAEKETSYQEKLEDLSQKQQEILKLKGGDENSSVGDYTPPSSKTPDPPFHPAFAAFSYGAYTHYNGMSQYGAKGRADAGKKYKEILKFYYKVDTEEKDGFPDEINVQGHGEMDFQYYLYGIAEMPTNWPKEALRAQAVAARTYAYRAGKPICTTESCQVFSKSKADKVENGDYPGWKSAVDDTENEILKDPKTAQYSSTTGGYINNVGWDVNGDWPGDAYEKKAGSPWFYRAWYTKGYSGSDSCGHPHPWLTEKEMADILNAWVVWRKGSGDDKEHISPVTTSCWGGDPWSLDDMADKADELGEEYTSVSSVDVDISNGGYTSSVKFSTNKGNISISGEEFKTVFNLRAPGYISLKSRLFDLEKK